MSDRTRSPFPGMDPWLESHWGDVHHEIISRLADQVAEALPADLFVTVQERVYILDPEEPRQRWVPDSGVLEFSDVTPGISSGRDADADTAVAEPIRITVAHEPVTEGVIEIRRLSDARPLVTAIEVLSPTNKCTAKGRQEYLRKREEYLRKREDYHRARVNLMEIDLLRCGPHLVDVPWASVRAEWVTPYKVAVRRWTPSMVGLEVEYYPVPLRKPLPRIRLPIRPDDDDIVLDLQKPIDYVYKRGRYDLQIDYGRPPDPPLSAGDAAWAAERVAAAGR